MISQKCPTKRFNEKGYVFTNRSSAIKSFCQSIKDGDQAICVAFRNETRNFINRQIRQHLFKDKAVNQFNVGETLIATSQFGKGGWRYGNYIPFGDPVIYNGQRFTIEKNTAR